MYLAQLHQQVWFAVPKAQQSSSTFPCACPGSKGLAARTLRLVKEIGTLWSEFPGVNLVLRHKILKEGTGAVAGYVSEQSKPARSTKHNDTKEQRQLNVFRGHPDPFRIIGYVCNHGWFNLSICPLLPLPKRAVFHGPTSPKWLCPRAWVVDYGNQGFHQGSDAEWFRDDRNIYEHIGV